MMASQQSGITSTSTPTNPGPMQPPRSTTSTGRTTSNATPTVSTQAPVLTDAVQKCVDTAAEAIATHREAKLVFMQGLVKRILREAYREPTTPPSVGTPLAQGVFAGVPPPTRPSPYFVTQPNYHDGQFHQYYPPENHTLISQSPATSVHTTSPHSTGMNTTQTSVTSTTSSTSTTPSTTAHCSSHAAVSIETYRILTIFALISLVESLTKTNLLLVSDMKGELQTINNQLSNIPINDIRKEQAQTADNLSERMSALEKGFVELRDVIMMRTNQSFKIDPELLEKWDPIMLVIKKVPGPT